jgi:hypothetical protein
VPQYDGSQYNRIGKRKSNRLRGFKIKQATKMFDLADPSRFIYKEMATGIPVSEGTGSCLIYANATPEWASPNKFC